MIVGTKTKGGTATNLAADNQYPSAAIAISGGHKIVKLTMPLDGLGSGAGDQTLRALVYEGKANGLLLGASEEVTIADGSALAWVDFPFASPLAVPAGSYYLSVQATGTSQTTRAYAGGALTGTADGWSNGPLPSLGTPTLNATLSIFATLIKSYAPSATVSERTIASLPVPDASAILGSTAPDPSTATRATCGWHGTRFAEEDGAFAIVKLDGGLEHLVGERVKITADERVTYAYVYDERDIIEDISLTRRSFLALAEASVEELEVVIETMGAA